jgi:phenylacetate-CoA ligase
LDHLFKDSANVVQAQLFQEKPEEVTVRIVRDPEFSALDEKKILEEARVRLGTDIGIHFEYVEALERTRNGKIRFVVSKVNQGEILKALLGA